MQIVSNNIPQNKISFSAARIKFKTFGDVPDSFKKEMAEGVKEFPDILTTKLKRTGILGGKLRLTEKASDAHPDRPDIQKILKNPNGNRETYDNLLNGSRIVDKKNQFFSVGFYFNALKPMPASRETVGHELSHVVDELTEKQIGMKFSQTNGFKEVFKNDLTNLSENSKCYPKLFKKFGSVHLKYYLQGSTPEKITPLGAEEIFSECGASLTTGGSEKVENNIKFMEKIFPESRAYVEKYFNLLGMK